MGDASREAVEKLVSNLLAAGCDMWAVGAGYCIGEPECEPGASRVSEILREFGPRDHLLPNIRDYLRDIDRFLDV